MLEKSRTEWSYYNPVQVIFGDGAVEMLPDFLPWGKILLVTTPGFTRRGLTGRISDLLSNRALLVFDRVTPNPSLTDLEKSTKSLRDEGIQAVVGLGGGSVLDSAKVFSFLLGLSGRDFSLRGYFEKGGDLPQAETLPMLSIPTTAGTGSEVTPFATVWDMQNERKYSLASPGLFTRTALLDPELTLTLPGEITVMSGLDALSHAFEAIWNNNSAPVTTGHAIRAISLILGNLVSLKDDLKNLALRSRLMEASLLAGLAISNTRTALAHSISYPLTARFKIPHGLACSFTLPGILEFNAASDDGRLAETASLLGSGSIAGLQITLLEMLQELAVDKMLKGYITSIDEIAALIPQMYTPGRTENNLRGATRGQIKDILTASWDGLFR